MDNRRQTRRWPRRVQVRFWRPEQPTQVFQGYTTDVSEAGAFIVTGSPIGTNTRIRVELLDENRGFVAEAIVRRSLRLHRDLQTLRSGMGVRFLGITELIHELLPHAEAVDERSESSSTDHHLHAEQTISAEDIVAAAAASETASRASMRSPAPRLTDGEPILREVPVRFRGLEDLRQIYERDLQNGGLFVATTSPQPVGTRVRLLIYLPDSPEPVEADAQVVHVFEPGAPMPRGRNLLTGMGVLFDDPSKVLTHVRPLVAGPGSLPRSGA